MSTVNPWPHLNLPTTTAPYRLYIAGPMTGLPDLNYPAFDRAAAALAAAGYDVVNPHDGVQAPDNEDHPWAWYMRRAVVKVAHVEGVALLPGWEHSRGARLEHHLAGELGLPRYSLTVWHLLAMDARTQGISVRDLGGIRKS